MGFGSITQRISSVNYRFHLSSLNNIFKKIKFFCTAYRQSTPRNRLLIVPLLPFQTNIITGTVFGGQVNAEKTEYHEYLRLSFNKVRDGGLVIAEDVTLCRDLMKEFLSEVSSHKKLYTVIIPYDDGISISYKKK